MKFKREYVIQKVGGLQVAVSPETSDMIKLTPSGALIFSRIARGADEPEIIDALAAEYPDVPRETLAADAAAFISKLREANLLTD